MKKILLSTFSLILSLVAQAATLGSFRSTYMPDGVWVESIFNDNEADAFMDFRADPQTSFVFGEDVPVLCAVFQVNSAINLFALNFDVELPTSRGTYTMSGTTTTDRSNERLTHGLLCLPLMDPMLLPPGSYTARITASASGYQSVTQYVQYQVRESTMSKLEAVSGRDGSCVRYYNMGHWGFVSNDPIYGYYEWRPFVPLIDPNDSLPCLTTEACTKNGRAVQRLHANSNLLFDFYQAYDGGTLTFQRLNVDSTARQYVSEQRVQLVIPKNTDFQWIYTRNSDPYNLLSTTLHAASVDDLKVTPLANVTFYPNRGSPTPDPILVPWGKTYADVVYVNGTSGPRFPSSGPAIPPPARHSGDYLYTYTFDGWYDGGTKVSSWTTVPERENIELTAKWIETRTYVGPDDDDDDDDDDPEIPNAQTYSVVFNKNDGSGVVMGQTITYGVRTALRTLASMSWSRSGYTFLGWSGNAAAKSADYADGERVLNLTTRGGTIRLYAVWAGSAVPYQPTIAEAVNQPKRTFTLSGPSGRNWFVDTSVSHDGKMSARSGRIGGNESCSVSTTVVGPKIMSFWCKTSSESGYDELVFTVDGKSVASVPSLSGKTEWISRSVEIGTGSHDVKWTYSKDGSVSDGEDCCWLDEISFANMEYKIRFIRNDGLGTIEQRTFPYGVSTHLPTIAELGWARKGYVFRGWATTAANASAGTVWLGDGAAVIQPASPNTTKDIYAIWEPASGYYGIKFNKNDGSGKWRAAAYPYGVETALPSCTGVLGWSREGYVFEGWSLTPNGPVWKPDRGVVSTGIPAGKTLNVYAVWARPPYTIRFIRNDGAGTVTNIVFRHGVATSLPLLSKLGWARRGMNFKGWATSTSLAAAGTVWKKDGGVVEAPTAIGATMDAVAIWTLQPDYYQIKFQKNDGTGKWRSVAYPYGVKTALASCAGGLGWTRPGYTFKGWSLSPNGPIWKTDRGICSTGIPAGQTRNVYAIWEKTPPQYTIRFIKNDGAGTVTNVVFRHGVKTSLPTIAQLGWTRRGMVLKGWATSTEQMANGPLWKTDGAIVESPVADGGSLDAIAVWALQSGYYQLKFQKNDGSGKWRSAAYKYGDKTTLPSCATGLGWKRDGYSFMGWSLSPDGPIWKPDRGICSTGIPAGTTRNVYAIWAKSTAKSAALK